MFPGFQNVVYMSPPCSLLQFVVFGYCPMTGVKIDITLKKLAETTSYSILFLTELNFVRNAWASLVPLYVCIKCLVTIDNIFVNLE
jgi:hypothetical protein